MSTQENNLIKPLSGLKCKDEGDVKIVQRACDMNNLLSYIENESFTSSDEEGSIFDDLEDRVSYEYIELPEGIYGKIINTLPNLPDDDSNLTTKICSKKYNLKQCSVVLEKINKTSLVCVGDKLTIISEENHVGRLKNVTNLGKKRNHCFSEKINKKVKADPNELNLSTSDFESDDDTSNFNVLENLLNSICRDKEEDIEEKSDSFNDSD
ncbi:hypothetical protein RN001_003795 [Aquatica leii]|uniref:Uncharacterized protein n=1 Tax=Aquatica leii TaxID=1421715 RepID=A0AAN7Q6N2_9COLE|nr:hypothetical protein RN001_003795 [Aquatica leii]